jgi:ubiquinone/menaquinone biosynthesis C-methylase UbiE
MISLRVLPVSARFSMPDFATGATRFDEQRSFPEAIGAELRDIVLARVPGGPQAWLLETGIGTGRIAAPFAAAGCRYTGLDSSPAMLARCRGRFGKAAGPRADLVLGDMRRLPFPDGRFDAVLAASVYRVAAPWQMAAAEASRVLARPGVICLMKHVVASGSMEHVLAERKREILASLGAGRYPEGGASDEEVAGFFAERGATVERIETAAWNTTATPRACLARYLRGSRVAITPYAEPLRRELEAFAVKQYASLDIEEEVARTMRVLIIGLAARS